VSKTARNNTVFGTPFQYDAPHNIEFMAALFGQASLNTIRFWRWFLDKLLLRYFLSARVAAYAAVVSVKVSILKG